jgi:MFS family permease
MITRVGATPRTLGRRLLPLQIGMALQGLLLWVPIEKLFMTQIGFDAASVGVMAAAYAAVVPLLEVPSGILADRWSRRWVMILGCIALLVSSLIGGLSRNVIAYVIAAMILGVYFACSSGTVDSVVYDTVLEETGSNELYEKWIGRIRAVESAAFVLSALAGGVLAQYTSARFTYFATVPLVGLAIIGFLRFDEPRLHQAAERVTLRSHVALTFRTMITSRTVLRVLLLVATAGLLSQAVFEFGPLWLVALAAPAVLYGPYWAVLVSTLGVAGLLISKVHVERWLMLAVLIILSLAAALLLTWTRSLAGVVTAQVVLALVLAIIGIHASRLLHDAVPSSIRAGVSLGRRDDDVGAVPAFFTGVWLDGAGERGSLVRIPAGRRRPGRRGAARPRRPGQPRRGAGRSGSNRKRGGGGSDAGCGGTGVQTTRGAGGRLPRRCALARAEGEV